jgi:hypothetical protein
MKKGILILILLAFVYSTDLVKSVINNENRGNSFDGNNEAVFSDSFNKSLLKNPAIPNEKKDISIGVCKCVLSYGESFIKCEAQCPLFDFRGEPIYYKDSMLRVRYFEPINTDDSFMRDRFYKIGSDEICFGLNVKRGLSFKIESRFKIEDRIICVGKEFPNPKGSVVLDTFGWRKVEEIKRKEGVDRERMGQMYYVVAMREGMGDRIRYEVRIYDVNGEMVSEKEYKVERKGNMRIRMGKGLISGGEIF